MSWLIDSIVVLQVLRWTRGRFSLWFPVQPLPATPGAKRDSVHVSPSLNVVLLFKGYLLSHNEKQGDSTDASKQQQEFIQVEL